MNPRVESVTPLADNFTLVLRFTNGELRQFDVKPFLDKGFFRELKNRGYFNSVQVTLGSVAWPNGQDFCPDTLYEAGQPISESAVAEAA